MTIMAVFRTGLMSLGLWASVAVCAQTVQTLDVTAERARIAQQRAQHEAVFTNAEVACYRRFAVSDCLRDARKNRRSALDELRRQEVVLNDEERRIKGSQALQRTQNNISSESPAGVKP